MKHVAATGRVPSRLQWLLLLATLTMMATATASERFLERLSYQELDDKLVLRSEERRVGK